MKVLFVHPPNIPLSEVKEILAIERSREVNLNMPMGILYLASVLERDCPDSTIKIVDFMKSLKDFVSSNDRTSTTADEFFCRIICGVCMDLYLQLILPELLSIAVKESFLLCINNL